MVLMLQRIQSQINGKKEKIKIIRPSLIADFVETYYRRINKNGIMTVANTAFEIKMQA